MTGQKVKGLLAAYCILALAATALTGCAGRGKKPAGENPPGPSGIVISVGSTALLPLVEEAAKQFSAVNPNIQVSVQGGGSGTGLSQMSSRAANIGNSDIFAEEKSGIDAGRLVDTKVCVVGVAAVVNPEIPVDNLNKRQITGIFTGRITNWREIGGPDQKIIVINRSKGSGTRATFKAFALDGGEETPGAVEIDSSGQVKKAVSETPGAISYLALSYLDNSVKTVKLDGVEPSEENIISGRYPVWAYEHMYTLGRPAGHVKVFLDYMLSDEVQDTLVPGLGYIPLSKMKVARNVKGGRTGR
jgi:phosphate transport system substrate-binding protein